MLITINHFMSADVFTTIAVSGVVKDKLDVRKVHHRESYNDVLARVLEELELR